MRELWLPVVAASMIAVPGQAGAQVQLDPEFGVQVTVLANAASGAEDPDLTATLLDVVRAQEAFHRKHERFSAEPAAAGSAARDVELRVTAGTDFVVLVATAPGRGTQQVIVWHRRNMVETSSSGAGVASAPAAEETGR
jgi:hypothetical protein